MSSSPFSNPSGSYGIDATSVKAVKETLVERARDVVQTKNTLRKRKGSIRSSSRPSWKKAVSVIIKNSVLLLILLLLAQMIRKLSFNQESGFDSDLIIANSDYERRIAEVEAFLKTTTKMMQVQVDVVDRKVENEIAGLKNELSRIHDQLSKFSNKFIELDGKIESMEDDEVKKIVEDILDKIKVVENNGELKSDEIRAIAREVVEEEIDNSILNNIVYLVK